MAGQCPPATLPVALYSPEPQRAFAQTVPFAINALTLDLSTAPACLTLVKGTEASGAIPERASKLCPGQH